MNYMWSMLRRDGDFPIRDLKPKDIAVLKTLLVDRTGDLTVASSTSGKVCRYMVDADDFQYAFLVSEVVISDVMKTSFNQVCLDDGVFIDLVQLYKMVGLAAELSYGTGRVHLNNREDGSLEVTIKTRKGADDTFLLSGSTVGKLKTLEQPLVLQAKILKLLLRAFSNGATVKVTVTEKGLGLVNDFYSAVLFSAAG